jgi:hypothetical protein
MSDDAAGPYSPRSLAVRLRQDDVEGWTRHALLRAIAWGRLRRRQEHASLPALTASGPAAAAPVAGTGDGRAPVVAALLAHAERGLNLSVQLDHHAKTRASRPICEALPRRCTRQRSPD